MRVWPPTCEQQADLCTDGRVRCYKQYLHQIERTWFRSASYQRYHRGWMSLPPPVSSPNIWTNWLRWTPISITDSPWVLITIQKTRWFEAKVEFAPWSDSSDSQALSGCLIMWICQNIRLGSDSEVPHRVPFNCVTFMIKHCSNHALIQSPTTYHALNSHFILKFLSSETRRDILAAWQKFEVGNSRDWMVAYTTYVMYCAQ